MMPSGRRQELVVVVVFDLVSVVAGSRARMVAD